MKIFRKSARHVSGNTLLLCVVMMGLIGFLLVAYLTLVKNQNTVTARSQSWNSAMPVIEAGIEDALAHINLHGSTNLNCDGWTLSDNKYSIQRSLGEAYYVVSITNFAGGSPVVESLGYVPLPMLASVGGDTSILLADANNANPTMSYLGRGVRAALRSSALFSKGMVARDSINLNGNNVTSDSFDSSNPLYSTNGQYIGSKRKANGDVAVNNSLTNALNVGNADIYGHVSTGPNGIVAIGPNGVVGDVDWHQNHNGIEDGYLRTDMNVSFADVQPPWNGGAFTPTGGWVTNWTYSYDTNSASTTTVPYPSNPSGPVTTNYPVVSSTYPVGSPGPVTSDGVTNSTEYGPANTYPPNPHGTVTTNNTTSSIYPPGSPGPVITNYNGAGHIQDYTYPRFTSVLYTYTTNYTYPTFTVTTSSTTTNSLHTETYYDYILDDGNYEKSSISGSIYVRGSAKLYVTSSLDLTDVVIANGKSLNLYCAAASASISGNNSANSAGLASSFHFWGLPTCTSISFSGNASFTGVIYAPNADFTLNGSGNDAIDFIGATITKSSKLNGDFNFHYDEALAREAGGSFVVSGWDEMEPKDVPSATSVLDLGRTLNLGQ